MPQVVRRLRHGSIRDLEAPSCGLPDNHRVLDHRTLVQSMLAEMLGLSDAEVSLEFNGGKPSICNFPHIYCSYSHTLDDLVMGVSEVAPLGIDIERLSRSVVRATALAAKHFHPLELAKLQQSGGIDQEFLRIWCLKEAWVKAIGGGIAKDFRRFSVIDENGETRLCSSDSPARGWLLDTVSDAHQERLVVGMAIVGMPGKVCFSWC